MVYFEKIPKHIVMRTEHKNKKKSFSCKYLKWLLWVSLSLYLLSSFLISTPSQPISPLLKPQKSSSLSRALLATITNPTVLQKQALEKPKGPLNDLKLYIYDLPPSYNTDWLSNPRCRNHLFAAEVALHKSLLTSSFRTLDPNEADFFFVPVYVSCNFSTINGFPTLSHAKPLLSSAVQYISSQMPFWNRSSGSDHVFVASHDFGACFHSIEDQAIVDGIPSFMKKSIVLQTFGVTFRHPCQDVENVLIPPYVSPKSVQRTLDSTPATGKRDIFVFFRGKMEIHPKDINGRFYSKGVRSAIWHKYSRKRRFYLKRERYDGYQSEIRRSVFCLCPLGWAPWSPRIVEAVALGCVPVIIADRIRLPFDDTIQWPKISITVAEKDVRKLDKILRHVANTNLTAIQKNLWDPVNRRAVLFNEKMQEGDATWQVLSSLSQKLHRSHSLARLSDE